MDLDDFQDFFPAKYAIDLGNHITNPNKTDEEIENENNAKKETEKNKKVLAAEDYQLHEALTLLKGLNILDQKS